MCQLNFYKDLTKKKQFLERWSSFYFNNLGLVKGMALKFHKSLAEGLRLKAREFWRLIPTCREVTRKTGRGRLFAPPPAVFGALFILMFYVSLKYKKNHSQILLNSSSETSWKTFQN